MATTHFLQMNADLKNVRSITPRLKSDFTFTFQVKCTSCGEVNKKEAVVTDSKNVKLSDFENVNAKIVCSCKLPGKINVGDMKIERTSTCAANEFMNFHFENLEPENDAHVDGVWSVTEGDGFTHKNVKLSSGTNEVELCGGELGEVTLSFKWL